MPSFIRQARRGETVRFSAVLPTATKKGGVVYGLAVDHSGLAGCDQGRIRSWRMFPPKPMGPFGVPEKVWGSKRHGVAAMPGAAAEPGATLEYNRQPAGQVNYMMLAPTAGRAAPGAHTAKFCPRAARHADGTVRKMLGSR
jgi:hypothetical protein